ncbi:hypothetical protein CO151_11545 [bacterium CG_4_9_14_3_um_filter_65_15]|nr:MAG: hypothetical protein CO151_11545 [bacterium CG_4_9_14_3_um_filter_65_15]
MKSGTRRIIFMVSWVGRYHDKGVDMKWIGISILFVAVLPAAALAGGALSASCQGDSVHIGIAVIGYFDTPQFANVEARVLGSCEPAVRLNPEPFPWSETEYEPVFYDFTVPDFGPGRYVEYMLYREDLEGNRYMVVPMGDPVPYDMEACSDDAVFIRGKLWNYSGYLTLEVCENHCWTAIDLMFGHAAPGWDGYVNTGQVVDLYGEAYVDGMPGGTALDVFRVDPVTDPEGCNAVPEAQTSWGRLKAQYR